MPLEIWKQARAPPVTGYGAASAPAEVAEAGAVSRAELRLVDAGARVASADKPAREPDAGARQDFGHQVRVALVEHGEALLAAVFAVA